ncbi:MAG: aryl sulfotransferase [SAR202 cluster bacterium]|nr:aryl sulfotransferase [Chloroflexota bacterium]MQF96444.1 aryl sulfotransferase [SAR202 cluster bacterium]HAA95986.1 aryl sulfotransferase [Dehalococcoidia bacterium]MBO19777.1 aryl sulfotransferase [Chloroflexota bacterium]MQG34225.1 aryl sulfotransferase [SAR202 cluster bacterium]|tara:strand:+ start:1739 stop:2902 length:1164 start_codon:yes stop_codon:yes gene_type:complete
MGWSIHHQRGLIHYSPQNSFRGYTLFSNLGGNQTNLIDMEGRVCQTWHAEEGINYSYLLPNGNLLLRTGPPSQEVSFLDSPERALLPRGGRTASGAIMELDWDSNVVWSYRDPFLHHDFERLSNGNTLVLLWRAIPEELASQVSGGFDDGTAKGQMLGDVVREVTPGGDTVSEWHSWEHLNLEEDIICHLEGRLEWTHQNCLNLTDEGDLLVSFRQTDTVGIVDRSSGAFTWKWGPGDISHQHNPTYLGSGRVLLFDNGPHRQGMSRSRVIEIDTNNNQIAWEYEGDPPISFFSYHISGAERLPNGNTLICEGAPGRIFEVTPTKEIVWEYINPFTAKGGLHAGGTTSGYANSVFRAHRYGPDHPALQGKDLDPARYANLNRLYSLE